MPRNFICCVLLLLSFGAAALLRGGAASAHGGGPNLSLYCQEKHGRAASARYNVSTSRWNCVLPGQIRVDTIKPDEVADIDVVAVCQRQYRTEKAHFHEGDDVHREASVHCGEVDGFVAKPTANASMNICHRRGGGSLWIAYAYFDATDRTRGWSTVGWFEVVAGSCRRIVLDRPYRDDLYIYGRHAGDAAIDGGDASFCLNVEASFARANADKDPCRGAALRRVPMRKLLRDGAVFSWTFE